MDTNQGWNNLRNRVRAVPQWAWMLCLIVGLGIFLRTYEFRDWMTFNPDQARDALVVQDMLAGKGWPLLGPQAGNTYFRLGSIFYYFEFVSSFFFGSSAEKMAYPDVLASILAIGLMYPFLRKFFERNIALAGTFLFSLSFFVVTYSRFAFNPNAIPFYVLLFLLALLQILERAPRETLGWAALLGIAMGIGFQLHTILFIALPLLAVLTLGYLFATRRFVWKSALVALACFALVNTTQLLSEWTTGAANIRSFFSGASSDARGTGKNFWQDLSNDTLCHIQGETYILSSLGTGDKCDLPKLWSRIEKKGWSANADRAAIALFGLCFTLGGLILFAREVKKEQDHQRRQAFVLVALYSLIIFAILFPVSSSVSIRYFIVVEFVPFLLLGFWIKFILEKVPGRRAILLAGFLVAGLVVGNLSTIRAAVVAFSHQSASTDNVAYFGEVAALSRCIIDRSPDAKTIHLSGKKAYLSRYGKQLEYFGRQQGVTVSKTYKPDTLNADDPFFYVLKKITKKDTLPEVIKGFQSEEVCTVGNVTILKLGRTLPTHQ